MNQEQEARWREEFEAYCREEYPALSLQHDSFEGNDCYFNDQIDDMSIGYLAARQKAQEEAADRERQIEVILKHEQSRVSYWKGEITKLKEEIDKINNAYALIMKSFCEENDEKIQKRDRLLEQAKDLIKYNSWQETKRQVQWLKDVEELKK